MPVIVVLGIPAGTSEETLEAIRDNCAKEVSAIEELNLAPSQMSFFFPPDMMASGLGEEIIVFVAGLFTKPERTSVVRNRLAKALGTVIKTQFREAMVEVFTHPFDPANGFWISKRPVNVYRANRELERMLGPAVNRGCLDHRD
jgi:hypothetical protein